MPVYRYAWSSLALQDLTLNVPGSPTVGSTGPSIYVDVTAPTGSKADLDDYMSSKGYAFVSTDPASTPGSQSSGTILTASDYTTYAQKTTPVGADRLLIEDSTASGAKKYVSIGSLPSSSGSTLAVTQARRTTNYTMTTSWVDLDYDVTDIETDPSVVNHLAGTPDRIQVLVAGTYQITRSHEVMLSATGNVEGRVVVNDTTVINGSYTKDNVYTAETDFIFSSCIATLAANDFLTVQVQANTAGTLYSTGILIVQKLDGVKGDTGATGSGSNITVQEDGTPVTGTPHSTLNFGPGILATNTGGGVAQVALDAYPPIADIGVTDPTSPTSGVKLLSRFRTGKHMSGQIDQNGLHYTFQPALFSMNVFRWQAQGGATTVSLFGFVNTTTGTATARVPASTSFAASLKRVGYVSSTSVGSSAGTRHAVNEWWSGNAAGLGGFLYVARFNIAQVQSGMRMFVGMTNTTTALPNSNPSTWTNMVGVALDATDSTIQFMYNGASGTAIKASTGLARPTVTDVYEFRLYVPPNGGTYYWSLENLTPTAATIVEGNTAASTSVPSNATFLGPQIWVNNASTALAVAVDVISQYLESEV